MPSEDATRTASSNPRGAYAPRPERTCCRTRSTTARSSGSSDASDVRATGGPEAEHRLGGGVEVEDGSGRVEHEHGVREAVDRGLRSLLRLEQLAQRAPPVLGQPLCHGVELLRERGDLVLAVDTGARSEVALAEAAHRLGEHAEGMQEPRRERE